jgi:threonyl-tRNA synthetase
MSSQMVNLCQKGLKFERLEVSTDLALDMFENNGCKTEQIPHIASQMSEGKHTGIFMIFCRDLIYPEYQICIF